MKRAMTLSLMKTTPADMTILADFAFGTTKLRYQEVFRLDGGEICYKVTGKQSQSLTSGWYAARSIDRRGRLLRGTGSLWY
eukprot:1280376-Amphidinium_carterae.1